MRSLSTRLRELMRERGWNQRETASRVGLKPSTVNRILAEEHKTVMAETALDICSTFGVSPFWLVRGEGKREAVDGVPAFDERAFLELIETAETAWQDLGLEIPPSRKARLLLACYRNIMAGSEPPTTEAIKNLSIALTTA